MRALDAARLAFALSFVLALASPAVRAAEPAHDIKGLYLMTDYPSVTVRPGTTSNISLRLQDYGLAPDRYQLSVAGVPVPIAVAAGILVGGLMGLLNGLLVSKIKLPPFIVTLGTLSIYRALKLAYSQSESVRNSDIMDKAPSLLFFGNGFKVGTGTITYGMIGLIILAFIVWYMLNRTAWGRHVHAIGDDPDAAMLSGIKVDRTLISVYTLAGVICGIAAFVAVGRVGSVTPIGFETMNLDTITAVVIGGTSLFGGRGSVVGSVLGAVIVQVFTTGLSLASVDSYWQTFAAGCLVIIAVALDQYLRRATK